MLKVTVKVLEYVGMTDLLYIYTAECTSECISKNGQIFDVVMNLWNLVTYFSDDPVGKRLHIPYIPVQWHNRGVRYIGHGVIDDVSTLTGAPVMDRSQVK